MSYLNVEAAARKVLELYHPSSTLPVDPIYIASTIGIKVSPSRNAGGYVIAYIDPDSNDYIIEVDSHNSLSDHNGAVACALGHHVLGHTKTGKRFKDDFLYPEGSTTPEGIDASNFAVELLMPANLVLAAFTSNKISSVQAMARTFGVSIGAIKRRLKDLGLAMLD